ncbi:MAG: hypothetical protein WBP93_09365 [Pyrinomonadaceae bacterium]
MIEIGVGVLFAVLFIAAYLLYVKMRDSWRSGRKSFRAPTAPYLLDDRPKELKANERQRALTAGELSQHHARGRRG